MFASADIVKDLFKKFDAYLRNNGFQTMKGQIIDATLVTPGVDLAFDLKPTNDLFF